MSEEHKVCWNDSERPTIKLAREITEWYQGSPGTSKIPPWAVNLAAYLRDKGYSQNEVSSNPEQFTEARQTVQFHARQTGKTNQTVERILALAEERGLDINVVYPEQHTE